MEKIKRIALGRAIKNICAGVLPYRTSVTFLTKRDKEMGYSLIEKIGNTDKASIYINPEHEMFNYVPEVKKYIYAFGVSVHEMLHVWFTDFEAFKAEILKIKDPAERRIFKTFFNMDEDDFIEDHVEEVMGGDAPKFLEETKKFTFGMSQDITNIKDPVDQIIAALIQYGDAKQIKGTFMNDDVKNDFIHLADLTDEAIKAGKCSERIAIARKQASYVMQKYGQTSYMPDNNDIKSENGKGHDARTDGNESADKKRQKIKRKLQQQSQQETENPEKNPEDEDSDGYQTESGGEEKTSPDGFSEDEIDDEGIGNESGNNAEGNSENNSEEDSEGNTGDKSEENAGENPAEGQENSEDGNASESSENSSESSEGDAGDADNASGSGNEEDEDEEDEDSLTPEQEKELEEQLEKAVEEAINEAAERVRSEMKRGSSTTFEIKEDPESNEGTITEIPIVEEDIDNYEIFDADNDISGRARALTILLEPVFKSKKHGKAASNVGKLNVKRLTNGKLTPYVFDKRQEKINDASVLILIDQSGSMHGRNMNEAKAMACEMCETFDKLNIPFCVLGHSARRKSYDDVDIRVYKDFNQKNWQSLAGIFADDCNHDGTAIRLAKEFLRTRREKNKVMFVITDGLSHNVPNCAKAVSEVQKFATIVGISLEVGEDDVKRMEEMYGKDRYINCRDSSDLNTLLSAKLKELAKNW